MGLAVNERLICLCHEGQEIRLLQFEPQGDTAVKGSGALHCSTVYNDLTGDIACSLSQAKSTESVAKKGNKAPAAKI